MEVNCQCDSTVAYNIIGTNNERNFTPVRYWRFYLNTADPAPCNGTINSWRYCFYNPGSINNGHEYKTTFAVYREVGTDYQKVMSSETTVSWHGRDMHRSQNFNCYNVSVDGFIVQAGDLVAACIYNPSGLARQFDLDGRSVSGSLKQTFINQCNQNSLPSAVSDNLLSNENSRVLHLYATIIGR